MELLRDVQLSLGEMYAQGQYIHGDTRIEACAYGPAACRKVQPSERIPSPGKGLKNTL